VLAGVLHGQVVQLELTVDGGEVLVGGLAQVDPQQAVTAGHEVGDVVGVVHDLRAVRAVGEDRDHEGWSSGT
jgi:hypothetical protein